MLQRIREKKALGQGIGGVGLGTGERELSKAYERGEWCISGLFLYISP